jgi:hypothetical protein
MISYGNKYLAKQSVIFDNNNIPRIALNIIDLTSNVNLLIGPYKFFGFSPDGRYAVVEYYGYSSGDSIFRVIDLHKLKNGNEKFIDVLNMPRPERMTPSNEHFIKPGTGIDTLITLNKPVKGNWIIGLSNYINIYSLKDKQFFKMIDIQDIWYENNIKPYGYCVGDNRIFLLDKNSKSKCIVIIDIAKRSKKFIRLENSASMINASYDGNLLVYCISKQIYIYDTELDRVIAEFSLEFYPCHVSIDSINRKLAIGKRPNNIDKGEVIIYDINTKKHRKIPL